VPLTRADCVCHLAEFASQSLRSWTRSTCRVVDSCILAILRERSLRALIALSTSISCAHHGATARDRLLRACLPNFLSIIQTLILRTQRSSQWLKSKKSIRVEIYLFWVLTLPFPSVFLDMLRSLFLLLLALLFELSDMLLFILTLFTWLPLLIFTSEELPLWFSLWFEEHLLCSAAPVDVPPVAPVEEESQVPVYTNPAMMLCELCAWPKFIFPAPTSANSLP